MPGLVCHHKASSNDFVHDGHPASGTVRAGINELLHFESVCNANPIQERRHDGPVHHMHPTDNLPLGATAECTDGHARSVGQEAPVAGPFSVGANPIGAVTRKLRCLAICHN